MLRLPLLVLLALALLPGRARAADEAPPCQPGKPAEVELVGLWPVGDVNLRSHEGGTVKLRVSNRTGRVMCRVFGELTLDGKARPVTCHEPAVEAGGEAEMLCTFMLLTGERKGGISLPGARRPGTPAPKDKERIKVRVKATGIELADPKVYKEWLARREEARKRALARAAAARAGFRHVITVKRASSAKEVSEHLDRAFARLKECFIARAKRNAKLQIELQLRLGVSRSRTSDGPPESLLAVKVLAGKGPRTEVRDCLGVLELTTLPQGLDFEALADVTYTATPDDKSDGTP